MIEIVAIHVPMSMISRIPIIMMSSKWHIAWLDRHLDFQDGCRNMHIGLIMLIKPYGRVQI